jgi:hypothetical protein
MIFLNHGHKFSDIEAVKSELSPKILDLAPRGCSNFKEIPFLTVGKDIGERVQVHISSDKGIFVEDYKTEKGDVLRQLVFASKPEQIQSEIQLTYRNTKKGTPVREHSKATSSLAPKKKQKALVYNHDLLCAEYQQSMLAGLSLVPLLAPLDHVRVLVLGTGAGLLPMFVRS